MGSNFNSLAAYRLSVALADELHNVVSAWPELDKQTVGIQLIRAADSIGANIAEAYGRWTDAGLSDEVCVVLVMRQRCRVAVAA